ncbi:Protein CBG22489 [Caenorhabditis briggsae]|uniref:Protein CBG22489 n=1 Tax=Caenorhabditis briggsae TaxID=6238 RepID=A8Y2E1_CAEBR|nr:Protein CBG22489 [Caenorhabditis briggsae]CAP39062.2 Protein CBG22489 [Caenorhabditis briggsae]
MNIAVDTSVVEAAEAWDPIESVVEDPQLVFKFQFYSDVCCILSSIPHDF